MTLFPGQLRALVVDHTSASDFGKIPANYFSKIRDQQKIFYGHTSHGSQLITGMDMLEVKDDDVNPGLYDLPEIYEDSPDLGYPEWETNTRNYLKSNPDTTLVMWSWCGQLSEMTFAEVDQYLSKMDQLEEDYPKVAFVYMTGHLDGSGANGTLNKNNERIRDYCTNYNKVLYDFADIETYDPGGKPYPNGSDACEWCDNWCDTYSCLECADCAHSHCFNCYLKGKAFWWMLARIEGWSGEGGNGGTHDFYVQQSVGRDSNSGDSWGAGHALASIGRAIALAANTDGADTIHVAAGNYRETIGPVSRITLYGGYPQNGGSSRSNMTGTIINGENKRQGIRIDDCEDLIIDGFVIRNGLSGAHGGGILIVGSSSVTVSNNAIENNQTAAGGDGGGIAVMESSVILSKNKIINNTSGGDGGGIALKSSTTEVNQNIITNNFSSAWGGGLYIESSGQVVNNLIANNSADVGGGVSYGKDSDQSSAVLINNTIVGNSITTLYGGGVYCHENPNGVVVNCILWENSPGQIDKDFSSTIVVTYSDVQGGYSGTGNINSNPRFAGIGNYELIQDSPCIDSGSSALAPAVDLDGNTRPQGSGVDMGAYEYTTQAPTIESTSPESGAIEVEPTTAITVIFSDHMDASTINSQTFKVEDETGNKVSGTITVTNKTATLTPAAGLAEGQKYKVTLTTGIKNMEGEILAEEYTWEFSTSEENGGGGGCFISVLG